MRAWCRLATNSVASSKTNCDTNASMLFRQTVIFLTQIACVALTACDRIAGNELVTLSGNTMGTTFSVAISDPISKIERDDLKEQILETLDALEAVASTYRENSEISSLNSRSHGEWLPVSSELCSMLSLALQASKDTGGAFDITIGPLVELWGFGKTSSTEIPPSAADIDAAKNAIGSANIELNCLRNLVRKKAPKLTIDLSAWAKGHAVDQIAVQLEHLGLLNFLVEIGGEVRAKGQPEPNRDFIVAIENPLSAQRSNLPRMRLVDNAIATSGNYRNFFEFKGQRYSHTIDPRTGWPTTHNLEAVTVVHSSAAYADALATALLVLGTRDGLLLADALDIAAYFAVSNEDGLRYYSSSTLLRGEYLLDQQRDQPGTKQ